MVKEPRGAQRFSEEPGSTGGEAKNNNTNLMRKRSGDGKSKTASTENVNDDGVWTARARRHRRLMLAARAGVCAKPGHMAEIIIILIKQLDGHLCSATLFPPEKR